MLSLRPRCLDSLSRPGRMICIDRQGFSLIEPVMSSVLLLIGAIQIATLFDINMRAVENSRAINSADLEIHVMIDKVRNLGSSYNWCNGSGSVNTANCTKHISQDAQAFYSPSADRLRDFVASCKDPATQFSGSKNFDPSKDKIISNLSNFVNSLGNADSSEGVKITSVFEDEKIRRFKISFERSIAINGESRTLKRWLYLIPDLANWCP